MNYIVSITPDELSHLNITVKRWMAAVHEMVVPEEEDHEFSQQEIRTAIALTCDFLEVLIPLIQRANKAIE